MKIGIDVRTAAHPKAGKGVYTFELVRHLLDIDRSNEYILYTNALTQEFAHFKNAHIKIIHARPWLWHFKVIKDWTTREKGDVFFAPTSYIIPALLNKQWKSVLTVHDIVAFLHPHLHDTKATILEHLFFKMALRKTRAVLVPSNNTKADLVHHFKFVAEKVHVSHLATNDVFAKKTENLEEIKKKYNTPDCFMLTVGGLEPRKNISELIDAFEIIAEKYPACALVIVGGKGWKSINLQERIEKLQEKRALAAADKKRFGVPHIITLTSVPFNDLPALYKLATIFVFPSLYEGFGLPPLEAMASGTPVVCSNTGSLKEVVGDAALTFAPGKTKKLIEHLDNLLSDDNLRESLSKKGKDIAAKFSWKKTAEETLCIFKIINKQ